MGAVRLDRPKRRLIAAAPVRDRVVHHAVYRVLAPRLDRRLIDTTFACRDGYGSHRAVASYQGILLFSSGLSLADSPR